jgi:AraC-like DNA-binding protein
MFCTFKTIDRFHPDGFPINVKRLGPQESFRPQKHDFSEMVLVIGGSCSHRAGGKARLVSTGDVFVVSGKAAQEYKDLRDLSLVNILFRPDKLNLQPADLANLPGYQALFNLEPKGRQQHQLQRRLRLSPQELSAATALVDQLDEELQRRSSGFGFVTTALFMQLVGHLSRCYGRSTNTSSDALQRIARAIAYVEANFDKPIGLDELARIPHMSERSLTRAFQAATGRPPISYLIEQRVSRAATLLRKNTDTITEIAFRVGFSDSNYFSRQFRQVFGMTPRDYRRRQTCTSLSLTPTS